MPRLDSAMIAAAPRARQRLTISGVVQGVGFRPFVYGLALEHGLAGFVGNDSSGVFVEVEGTTEAIAAFRAGLVEQAPPLAHIERIEEDAVEPLGETSFIIVPSQALTSRSTLVAPDVCVCDACLAELFDPSDRRYRYPFINCTHCGPRFSIIQDIPYDRPKTTMAAFVMCKTCQAEYDDPTNRRFHAQPNACPVCGPQVRFEWPASMPSGRGWDVQDLPDEGPIEAARRVIAQGGIVAVKGLGGFHLACDATNDEALATLRQRKGRVDKPFAIMARDLATARAIAHVDDDEAALLSSRARPIVLLRKRAGSPISEHVAPGNRMVGVMLPYTPLHYLLLGAYPFDGSDSSDSLTSDPLPPATCHLPPATLVLTSGNLSDEPIIKDDDEARERLTALADAFLLHNREIYARCDDSVMRVFEGKELPVRRSRGYAPFPVKLPFSLPTTLAVGGELKATFCLTRDNHAFMSQHIGDMENLETLDAFEQAVEHFKSIFRARPERIVSDLHPRYLSSRWATDHADGLQHLHVQHHHAHIAAVMAEHGLDGRLSVIGFAFDGTGYGTDGAIWGGEVLLADYHGFRRLAHLAYIPLPGGDAAIKRPYRIALAHLWAAGVPWTPGLPPVDACPEAEHRVLLRQLEAGINTVPTSSMGRLFDAVAALAGIRQTVTYEAQAAIEMEAEVESGEWRVEGEEKLELSRRQYEFALPAAMEDNVPVTFDAAPVIRAVAEDVRARTPVEVISARFHAAVADLILALAVQARQHSGQDVVALSGGVFQNVTLLAAAVDRLRSADFRVLTHRLVPPNDGGLALGQAVIGGLA